MSHHHGTLRGLDYVRKSSTNEGRFGRIFRWLPEEFFSEEMMLELASTMVQGEFLKAEVKELESLAEDISKVAKGLTGKDNATALTRVSTSRRGLSGSPALGGLVLETSQKDKPEFDVPIGESEPDDENPTIPAGYTYLGQFIDHDITFDPVSSLQRQNDPDAVKNFRTPRLDLDSLYGQGPKDQPYLYEGIKFVLGETDGRPQPNDLPRNSRGRALIGDPRNDENRIISQIHALFLRFHNKVVDELKKRPDLGRDEVFEEAQRIVRWHYQWIVLRDYLPRIVGKEMAEAVLLGETLLEDEKGIVGDNEVSLLLKSGRNEPDLQFYEPESGLAYIPVEFSVAAFRFGHSMVRPSYTLNEDIGGVRIPKDDKEEDDRFARVPIFSDKKETGKKPSRMSLKGFEELPSNWGLDYRLFFNEVSLGRKRKTVSSQPSYRIDTKLVDPLAQLPKEVTGHPDNRVLNPPVLALRNLQRGSRFGVPSGERVARLMGLEPLDEGQLWHGGKASFRKDQLWSFQKVLAGNAVVVEDRKELKDTFPELTRRTPLWYYILREAELVQAIPDKNEKKDSIGGHHLGPVGGRIVAEVLVGIAYHDHFSYLFLDPKWTPWQEPSRSGLAPILQKGQDKMADLIRWINPPDED